MLTMICAYLCIPVRFRFIARWLAAAFFLFIVVVVLTLFFRVLSTVPKHHGWQLQPQADQLSAIEFLRFPFAAGRHFKEGK